MNKRSKQIFNFLEKVLILIESVLAIRFTLRLLGASEAAWIVRVLYGISYSLVSPFQGIFPDWKIGAGMVVDWVTVSAIISYAIVYFVIHNVYFHEKTGK
jgi:hypothetical protein